MQAVQQADAYGKLRVGLATDKTIAAVGASDEDVAHLRLLMRKAAGDLTNTWRWGSEVGADLVVVDVGEFSGQMARVRAQTSGIRVALLCDAGTDPEGDLALYRPLRAATVVAVLNQVTVAVEVPNEIVPQRQDFYYGVEPEPTSVVRRPVRAPEDDTVPSMAPPKREVAVGLDELIRGDPLLDPFANVRAPRFDDDSVGIEDGGGSTRRSEARSEREPERKPNAAQAVRNLLPPSKRSIGEDRTPHPLRAFLAGDLLGGPAQIAWVDQAVLTLDPKNQMFHCEKTLGALEVYCREMPRRTDWRILTSAEIGLIRQSQPAQPYARLVWLDVMLKSGGRLAPHLDPGGTYQLTRWLEIRRDYPRLSRISTVMMQPLRLHEIVATSAAEMGEVFDVVNAYDAIGWLQWTPRAPRHSASPIDSGLSGLMSRLRKPFGR